MTLELFKKDTCPYCRKVLDYINGEGRTDIQFRDILNDPDSLERLIAIGGKKQVPCLFIDEKPLYESMDIIAWLQEHPE